MRWLLELGKLARRYEASLRIADQEILVLAEDDPWEGVEIIRDVNLAKLEWLSDKSQALIQNGEYIDLYGFSWKDVEEALAREEALLDSYSRLDGEVTEELDPGALDEKRTEDGWLEWY